MLWAIDGNENKLIEKIPHEEEFNIWRSRLNEEEYNAVVEKLNSIIEGDEVHTSSWIPGNDWSGTVFEPIYTKACRLNREMSGQCFGVILWKVMMDREDNWSFGRYEKNGIDLRGVTYFRLNS